MNYAAILNSAGLKATLQRIGILEVIDSAGHCSVDEISNLIDRKLPNLSLATIYKNVLMMTELNILVEVPIAGGKSKYEIKKMDHIHLICEVCGNVEDEILESTPQESLSAIAQRDSFALNRSQINLYGLCQNCK
ncbi:Peroxide stress regulator; Ferric uptake regulation protein; Fe2+/Zn2+ uptake regulation proteins [hydrothermal vent metagenome]|uniref:Peroxide stress regulator Ferric uptake regulation protein Fe2+/Zn2+ uptake regulation proteins n=1 Tax=hydrothermal vent metagenome TaxID=652676 RepID=A0A1W1B8I5_9ZZZZ